MGDYPTWPEVLGVVNSATARLEAVLGQLTRQLREHEDTCRAMVAETVQAARANRRATLTATVGAVSALAAVAAVILSAVAGL